MGEVIDGLEAQQGKESEDCEDSIGKPWLVLAGLNKCHKIRVNSTHWATDRGSQNRYETVQRPATLN